MKKRRGPPRNVNRYDENFYKRPKRTKLTRFYQGTFTPKFPEKYRGDLSNITYRSSWELRFMRMIDSDPNIIEWNSEGTIIPYYSDVDQKMRRYFIDFYLKIRNVDGSLSEFLVEIKPLSQIYPPKLPRGKLTEKRQLSYQSAMNTYNVNHNKWTATCNYIERQKNMNFKIVYVEEKTKKFVYLDARDVVGLN